MVPALNHTHRENVGHLFYKWILSICCLLRFAAYGEHPLRNRILVAYLRLHLSMLLSVVTRRQLRSFSLLGREMRFANPHVFSFLLMELFIEESYKGCEPPATILDLGSNIGMSILLFKSLWPRCKVFGVEASPEIFTMLQQNVQGLADVTVVNRAVSDRPGEIAFYSEPGSLMGSTNKLRGGAEGKVVQAVPISEFITAPLDLLKIDIEGSEIAAFVELEASGKIQMIRQMYIEYHYHLPGNSSSLAAFLERLERCGFDYELSAVMPDQCGDQQDILIRAKRK